MRGSAHVGAAGKPSAPLLSYRARKWLVSAVLFLLVLWRVVGTIRHGRHHSSLLGVDRDTLRPLTNSTPELRALEYAARERPFAYTLVVGVRNDVVRDFGFQRMLRVLDAQVGRLQLSVELIVVEWNPNNILAPLAEGMPRLPSLPSVRVIRAPRLLHARWAPAWMAAPTLLEFVARNVGARRARGRWVTGHAMDSMYTPELWQWLAAGGPETVQRQVTAQPAPPLMVRAPLLTTHVRVRRSSDRLLGEAELTDVRKRPWTLHLLQRHVITGWPPERLAAHSECTTALVNDGDELFTDAAGHFQLMTAASWMQLRGYVEAATYMHFDTVLMYMAQRAGMRFHTTAWPAMVVREAYNLNEPRWNFRETPYQQYYGPAGKPTPNGLDWGHAELDLDEVEWRYGVRVGLPPTEVPPTPTPAP